MAFIVLNWKQEVEKVVPTVRSCIKFFKLDGVDGMTAKELATQYRMSQWAGLLQERTASGESIKEFCESRGISRDRYYYWQRKLRIAAGAALQAQQKSDKMIPVGWAACEAEAARPPQSVGITIEIGKCCVSVGTGWDATVLQKVCRVLTELC